MINTIELLSSVIFQNIKSAYKMNHIYIYISQKLSETETQSRFIIGTKVKIKYTEKNFYLYNL